MRCILTPGRVAGSVYVEEDNDEQWRNDALRGRAVSSGHLDRLIGLNDALRQARQSSVTVIHALQALFHPVSFVGW